MDLAFFLFLTVVPLLVLIVGAVAGRIQERRHERSLQQREPRYRDMLVTGVRSVPSSVRATGGFLVVGHVVIGSDRGKQFVAGLRNLLGGRVRSFESVLTRARREALLRMLEDARVRSSDTVVNVRFETSEISNFAAEVLCYGTALSTAGTSA